MNRIFKDLIAVVVLLLVLSAIVGCSSSKEKEKGPSAPKATTTKTDKVVEYADALKTAVDRFESSREKTSATIAQTTEAANTELTKSTVDLKGAAKDWKDAGSRSEFM